MINEKLFRKDVNHKAPGWYLENGNIHNSVNYPNNDMGVLKQPMRVAILHRNIPNMLTQFTATFGERGINVERMNNAVKGEYGYAVMDLTTEASAEVVDTISHIEGVLKVRVMRRCQ